MKGIEKQRVAQRTSRKGSMMQSLPENEESRANMRFCLRYVTGALCLAIILLGFSHFAHIMSVPAFAIILALLTAISTPTIAYALIATKLHNRTLLSQTGFASKLTRGKTIRTIVAFILSLISMTGLLFSVVRWSLVEWGIFAIGVILCPFIFMLANKISNHEFKLEFNRTGTLIIGGLLLAAVLGAATAVVIVNSPAPQFDSLRDSFLAHSNAFENSPSTLLNDAGLVASYSDTVIAFLLSNVANVSRDGYVALQLIMTLSSLSGIVTLLSACMMPDCIRELFLPLVDIGETRTDERSRKPQIGLIALSAVLAVLPIGVCLYAEAKDAEIQSIEGISVGKQLIQDQIGVGVYAIDGKTYDQETVEMVLADMAGESAQLTDRVQNTLVPLINASFDKRIENVDNYLDWYYSIPADYERVLRAITGSVEDGLKDQLATSLAEGVDDSTLNGEMQACAEQAANLQEELESRLAACEVSNVPDWLLKPAEFDLKRLTEIEQPSEKLMEDNQRIIASVGGGAVGGFIAKKVVERAVKKEAVVKMATTLARSIGLKSASSAIGAAAGSAVPVAGNAAGLAAGTAIGVAIDFALLKADEAQNRQTYHDEIAEAIEQQRAEVLAALPQAPLAE